jgi:hypothetical protein
MGNAGWTNDDHGTSETFGEGRARRSLTDIEKLICPTSVAAVRAERGDRLNDPVDSNGHQVTAGFPHVDGDSNADGDYQPAAYPPFSSSG